MEPENPPAPPPARFERCLPCPCNAGSCRLLTSTQKHAGRQFYRCPLSAPEQCKFFKWADLVEPHELINVPYCGGCMAGVCRFTKVTSGPDAGRILFMCKVKEGQGSCGFRVWQDEVYTDMAVDFNLMSDEDPDNESRLNDTSVNTNIQCLDARFGSMELLKCQEDVSDELLRTPCKESQDGGEKIDRIMASKVQKALQRRKQQAGSSGAAPEKVPVVDMSVEVPSPTRGQGPSRDKRLISETMEETPVAVVQPLRQVRTRVDRPIPPKGTDKMGDMVTMERTREKVMEVDRRGVRLVGEGPSSGALAVARDLAALEDARFMNQMGWDDLVTRTCSSLAEAFLLMGEFATRATHVRRQSIEDTQIHEAIQNSVAEAKSLHDKEVASLKAQIGQKTVQETELRSLLDCQKEKYEVILRGLRIELELAHGMIVSVRQELERAQERAAQEKAKDAEEIAKAIEEKALAEQQMEDKLLVYVESGFNGCLAQFKEQGYLTEDAPVGFPSFDNVVDALPPDL